MYKNIIMVIMIVLLGACSAPKPKEIPSWYKNPPKDFQYIYAVGEGVNITKAKNIALKSLRVTLQKSLQKSFQVKKHPLGRFAKEKLKSIVQSNTALVMSMNLRGVKIEKMEVFKGKTLVLISLSREGLFKYLQESSKKTFDDVSYKYERAKRSNPLKRYTLLKPLIPKLAKLSSYAQLKQNIISTYKADKEFQLISGIYDEYIKLKSAIKFFVLSDSNSRGFAKKLKLAIKAEGFREGKVADTPYFYKILLKSTTTETQMYEFLKASTLLKVSVYDKEKRKIAFRQHTFAGKARKSYAEAKAQSVIHMRSRVRKLGLFEFIGIQDK